MSNKDIKPGPTKVLFCEGNIDGTIGGSYYSLLFLVAGLDRSRFEPVVVFRKSNSLIPRYNGLGIRTLVVPIPKPTAFRVPGLRVLQKLMNFVKFLPIDALRCSRLLRRENVDIVHLNNSVIRNHEWMLGAFLAHTPCITHERGINTSYSWLSRFLARRISGVICISQAVKESLDKGGVKPRTCPVIYNGIDPDEMTVAAPEGSIRERHDIPLKAQLIGVIGNIKQWKGQETAIRALPAVLANHPETYCMFVGDIANDDRQYFDSLNDLAKANGITDRVIFTGYTSDVPDYLNELDVVLHTSVAPEPFGRVLIEAMSLRKPLIGAAAGAVPEIIDEGKTGLTFRPGDADDLSRCINQLLDSAEAAEEMGVAGLARLEKLFHINTNVAATQNYYAAILRQEPTDPL